MTMINDRCESKLGWKQSKAQKHTHRCRDGKNKEISRERKKEREMEKEVFFSRNHVPSIFCGICCCASAIDDLSSFFICSWGICIGMTRECGSNIELIPIMFILSACMPLLFIMFVGDESCLFMFEKPFECCCCCCCCCCCWWWWWCCCCCCWWWCPTDPPIDMWLLCMPSGDAAFIMLSSWFCIAICDKFCWRFMWIFAIFRLPRFRLAPMPDIMLFMSADRRFMLLLLLLVWWPTPIDDCSIDMCCWFRCCCCCSFFMRFEARCSSNAEACVVAAADTVVFLRREAGNIVLDKCVYLGCIATCV